MSAHMHGLLHGIQQQLSDILQSSAGEQSNYEQPRRVEGACPGADDSGLDGDDADGTGALQRLAQIRELLGQVASDIGEQDTRRLAPPSADVTDVLSRVKVVGPPGTEPRPNVTNTRFSHGTSVVYSRCSSAIPLPFLPFVGVRPSTMKDSLRPTVIIDVNPATENVRWTRYSARTFGRRPAKPLNYYEATSSEESSESESDETVVSDFPDGNLSRSVSPGWGRGREAVEVELQSRGNRGVASSLLKEPTTSDVSRSTHSPSPSLLAALSPSTARAAPRGVVTLERAVPLSPPPSRAESHPRHPIHQPRSSPDSENSTDVDFGNPNFPRSPSTPPSVPDSESPSSLASPNFPSSPLSFLPVKSPYASPPTSFVFTNSPSPPSVPIPNKSPSPPLSLLSNSSPSPPLALPSHSPPSPPPSLPPSPPSPLSPPLRSPPAPHPPSGIFNVYQEIKATFGGHRHNVGFSLPKSGPVRRTEKKQKKEAAPGSYTEEAAKKQKKKAAQGSYTEEATKKASQGSYMEEVAMKAVPGSYMEETAKKASQGSYMEEAAKKQKKGSYTEQAAERKVELKRQLVPCIHKLTPAEVLRIKFDHSPSLSAGSESPRQPAVFAPSTTSYRVVSSADSWSGNEFVSDDQLVSGAKLPTDGGTPSRRRISSPRGKVLVEEPGTDSEESIRGRHDKVERSLATKKERRLSTKLLSEGKKQTNWSSDDDFDMLSLSQRKRKLASSKGNSVASESGKGPSLAKGRSPRGLPCVIPCTACGAGIHWKDKLTLEHPRHRVLICEKCFNRFHRGIFNVVDGNEEYCSMCGDGGDLVCCGTCVRSGCTECIRRVCGAEFLSQLISYDREWLCFDCDSAPLAPQRQTCVDLCKHLQRERLSTAKSRRVLDFNLVDTKDEKEQREHGGGTKKQNKTGDVGKKEGGEGRENKGKKSGGEQPSGGGSSRGGRGTGHRPAQSRPGGSSSESEWSSDTSSASEEVHSSEISFSDFGDVPEPARSRLKRGPRIRSDSNTSPSEQSSAVRSGAELSGAELSGVERSSAKQSSAKRRRRLRLDFSSLSSSSDVEALPPQTKRHPPSNSSSAGEGSMAPPPTKKKRRGIVELLSSGSEEDMSPRRPRHTLLLSNQTPPDSSDVDAAMAFPEPDSLHYRSPCEADSELSDKDQARGEHGKKHRWRARMLSSGDSSGSGPGTKGGRSTGKSLSSDSDFEEDLSRKGPRRHRGPKWVRMMLSSESEEADGEKNEKKKKGRVEAEKTESSDESTQQSTPGKKRKKIRQVMDESKLKDETRAAQQEEKERMERLKQRAKASEVAEKGEGFVLERDAAGSVLLEVRRSLVPHLKPHQREGIKFLFDSCVENVDRLREDSEAELKGAILAHCMGLGKSLQVIAFMDALLTREQCRVWRILVLGPVNTLHNWIHEYHRWIPPRYFDYKLYLLTDTSTKQRFDKLQKWFRHGGVMFAGYQMFRNLAIGERIKKQKAEFKRFLLDPGPDVIVCDEGHVMRNSKSRLSQVLGELKTLCRIVLTGTPLQNNLLEYYTMVTFVKPNLLGTPREFTNRFMNPITNGQCRDSSPHDVRLMKQRAHILHKLLSGSVQRRDYRVLAEFLPPKQEYVLSIRLSPLQDKLYRRYIDHESGYHTASDLFSTFANLSKVWNHPYVLKLCELRRQADKESGTGSDTSLSGFIVSDNDIGMAEVSNAKKKRKKASGQAASSSGTSCSSTPAASNGGVIVLSSDDETLPTYASSSAVKLETMPSEARPSQPTSRVATPSPPRPWYDDLLPNGDEVSKSLSGKFQFLLTLLHEADLLREKVLVFTQSLLTLDLIEEFLGREENGEWTPGLDYYRLDGSTRAEIRNSNMREFNKTVNRKLRLFLISTRAGSLGVNLVSANRVVIFDACWNPSHDLQAIFRTYRFGQTKPIFVYRLLAQGTMEEKIYDRQVTKQSLSLRVVDEKQAGRHFTASDLAELFTYSPAPPPPEPGCPTTTTPERPQVDITLCTILDKLQPTWIVQYHEHNSLLEHIFDEELSEADQKAAWESYNADKVAETAHYNFQALHSRLEQSTSVTVASSSQLPPPATLTHGVNVSNTLFSYLTKAIHDVDTLIMKQGHKVRLAQHVAQQVPPIQSVELMAVNQEIGQLYHDISVSIRDSNAALEAFNQQPVSTHPQVNQKVVELRRNLLQKIDWLRQMGAVQPVAAPSTRPDSRRLGQ